MCLILPVSAERKEDTPLGKQMEATGHALKGFRKETDPATTPISPPSGPATGSCNGLHLKGKRKNLNPGSKPVCLKR